MTIGRKIATAPSMTPRVSLLDDASHTVRPMLGSLEDGRRNGNSAMPAVAIVQTGTSALARSAAKGRPRETTARPAAITASTGTSHKAGCAEKFCSHAPGIVTTVLRSGLDGPPGSAPPAICAPVILGTQNPAAAKVTT